MMTNLLRSAFAANKLFSTIARLRLLLVMFLTLTVSAEVWGATWEKATSIAAGDVVLLVCDSKKMELSGVNTYGSGTAYSTSPAGLYELTVEAGSSSGTFSLKNGNNYLSWTSGNSLATSTSKTTNSSWKITFNSGNLTILNAKDNNRKLQWNASSPRFACYTSSQTAVQLYKKVTAVQTVAVTGVSLNETSLTLTEGSSKTLTASVSPDNATDKTVTWTTNNSSVATVSNGKVTAVAEGSAIITVTTNDGKKTATCDVTVNPKPKYTVTWDVNGDQSVTTQVTEGSKPTFPNTPESCNATSNTFYGWATATWDGKINDVSAKTIYTSANDMPAVNGAVTYYAVFAKTSEDSSGDYKLVTSLSNLKSGVAYLGSQISYSGVRYYYMSSTAISSNLLSISNATVSSNILQTPNSEGKINLVSTGTANQYYIKNVEGKYLYSNAAGSLSWSTTACSWTFSNMNSTTGLAELTSSANSNIKLRAYGTSTTQGKLKTYSGTTNNGICVFLAEATTTYSDYITTCTTKTSLCLTPKYGGDSGGTWRVVTEWYRKWQATCGGKQT